MKTTRLSFLLLLTPFFLFAESTISGIVKDKTTGEPIPGANIYISNSQIGTVSEEDGSFSLTISSDQQINLFFSFVGYKTVQQSIKPIEGLYLTVFLVPDKLQLEEYQIAITSDKEWERNLSKFESLFLGKDRFSKACEILNPWVLDFKEEKDGAFSASSNQVIKVRNRATGYDITYFLTDFNYRDNLTVYSGLASFEELEPQNLNEFNQWSENRRIAYKGSLRHFLKAVINNKLEDQGFEAKFYYDKATLTENFPAEELTVRQREVSDTTIFVYKNNLRILNFARYINIQYYGDEKGEQNQKSWLDLLAPVSVDDNGMPANPINVLTYGSMADENFAYLLPVEYQINESNAQALRFNKLVVNPFKVYQSEKPIEKLHVHTDKSLYFEKELIWLKGYTTIGSQPGFLSTKLFVQLIGPDGSIAKSIIPIKNGDAIGHIIIPEKIVSGSYLLKAYTNWSDSLNEAYHFQKIIQLGLTNEKKEKLASAKSAVLKLFPEGGNVISGVDNVIAFEVKSTENQYLKSVIEIYNDKNKLVKSTQTAWQGKGKFTFNPKPNRTYYAKVRNFKSEKVPIKITDNISISLKINEGKKAFNLALASNLKTKKPVHILITSSSQVVFFKTAILESKEEIKIDKSILKDGINQVTLFDFNYDPFAERLIFSSPNLTSDIHIKINNKEHTARDLSTLVISGKDEIQSASVSVIDLNTAYDSDEDNIFVSTYLKPELKGKLTGIDSTFTQFSERNSNLDLLMLVNGWRRYNWEKIKNKSISTDSISIENGFKIEGFLTYEKTEKPVDAMQVFLIVNDSSSNMLQAITDENGYFNFHNVSLKNSTDLMFKVIRDKKDKKPIKYTFLKKEWIAQNLKKYHTIEENTLNSNESSTKIDKEKILALQNFDGRTYFLDEATIKGNQNNLHSVIPRIYSSPGAKKIILADLPAHDTDNMWNVINGHFPGVKAVSELRADGGEDGSALVHRVYVQRNRYNSGNINVFNGKRDANVDGTAPSGDISNQNAAALIVVDNVPTSAEYIRFFNPTEVESIEILKGADASIFGPEGANGVVVIYTKTGQGYRALSKTPDFYQTKLEGYQNYKEFYVPDYSQADIAIPDLRTTLFWDPAINDQKRTLQYYNHDLEGRVKIILEGYDKKGKPFRSTDYYNLTKKGG